MKNTLKKLFCLALCAVLLLPAGAQTARSRAIRPGDAVLIYVRGSRKRKPLPAYVRSSQKSKPSSRRSQNGSGLSLPGDNT